jgi:hypothetical protein
MKFSLFEVLRVMITPQNYCGLLPQSMTKHLEGAD